MEEQQLESIVGKAWQEAEINKKKTKQEREKIKEKKHKPKPH